MDASQADRRSRVRNRATDPVFWTDMTQLGKTVAAAVIAWVLATSVLDLPQAFLAPWAALLVVNATVYRTFSQGARQVAAAVLGVVLAWAAGNTLGLDATAVAVVLTVGLGLGSLRWFGGEATTVAATALVVLTTGFSDDDNMLALRLLDTAIGIGVGLLVNLVVWPPLRRRTAISAMNAIDDEVGALLLEIGEGIGEGCGDADVEGWLERTQTLDGELDHAWVLVRQAKESARMNPRRSAREVKDPQQWYALLERMQQAVAEIRSMAGTLGHGVAGVDEWLPEFKEPFARLLGDAGRAIAAADPDPVHRAREHLNALADDLGGLPTSRLWPVYGALMINLRNILGAMDEVAVANPMSQPPLPFRRRR